MIKHQLGERGWNEASWGSLELVGSKAACTAVECLPSSAVFPESGVPLAGFWVEMLW